ncbi:omega-amidase [Acrasis kona]|uniref:Omega-amidase n=1 Tax=Acrasis kona TaxID=1008807 RepID=A0AAW2ZNV8_9EUKA
MLRVLGQNFLKKSIATKFSSRMSHFIKTDMKLNIALCQLDVCDDKRTNIDNAVKNIREAANKGANLVMLPECFNSPYGTKHFPQYAEGLEDSETLSAISSVASEKNIYIVAGSIPTIENGKYYNTSCAYNTKGERIAVLRKVHLFDINVPGKIVFQESEILTAGDQFATFELEHDDKTIKVGMGICFDIRFAEMAQIYQKQNCSLLVYPGAFNMTTGPAHWELLARARAVDNQLFVALCSPARNTSSGYVAYGHSLIVDPWGSKVVEADENPTVVFGEADFSKVSELRDQIPSVKNKRSDLYTLINHNK